MANERAAVPAAILRCFRLLLDGHTRAAEAVLREYHYEKSYWAQHRQAGAVARVEAVFRQCAGTEPWPSDLSDQHRQFWRLKLAGLLVELPVALVIDDLKATAAGKGSLIYYMSSDRGTRASRWEMLLCDHREAEWQKVKQEEKEAAKSFDLGGLAKKVDPDWVKEARMRLKINGLLLNDSKSSPADKELLKQNNERIREQLGKHGFTEE